MENLVVLILATTERPYHVNNYVIIQVIIQFYNTKKCANKELKVMIYQKNEPKVFTRE